MKERSLIIFTLLSQLAVGLFVTQLVCFAWFLCTVGFDQAMYWCRPGSFVVAGSMVAAALTSFFHLGNPRNAWRVASNFSSSWLSREIILVIAFTGITVLIAGYVAASLPMPGILYALGAIGLLVGITLAFTMSRIYCQRTVPAWNTWQTVAQFLLTTLSIGTAATSLLLSVNAYLPVDLRLASLRVAGICLGVLLPLQIVSLVFWLNPARKTSAYMESLDLLTGKHRQILVAHIWLMIAAVFTAGAGLLFDYEGAWPIQRAVLWITVLLVFTAQVYGRGLFYIARVRDGV